jgi:hypothetical protein
VDKRVPALDGGDDDLLFGRAMHLALASWYNGCSFSECVDAAFAELPACYTRSRHTAEAMLHGYLHRFGEKDRERWTVLAVEHPFEFDAGGGARIKGSIDLVVRTESGSTLIVEHKTVKTASLADGSEVWERRARDLQWQVYVLAWQHHGHRCDGVVYNLLRRPQMRARKNESAQQLQSRIREAVTGDGAEGYFARMLVPFGEKQLTDARLDIIDWYTSMKVFRDAGLAPRNLEACTKFGRVCEYHATCHGGVPITDDEHYKPAPRLEVLP